VQPQKTELELEDILEAVDTPQRVSDPSSQSLLSLGHFEGQLFLFTLHTSYLPLSFDSRKGGGKKN
jgi:hypothetical protein